MAMCCCPTATPSSLDGIEVVASATPSLPVTPTERRSDSGLYSSPKDRSSGSAKNLARYSMTEFSPMGRVKKPTAMTPEQREGQRERKVAMRQAVRDLIKDHEELSRTQRLKLKMAATAVRTTTKIGRRGPAEGSVLDPREHHLRRNHLDQQSMREETLVAVLASISARRESEVSGVSSDPTPIDAGRPSLSPSSPPMVRKWASSDALLQTSSRRGSGLTSPAASGRLSATNAPPVHISPTPAQLRRDSSASQASFYSAKEDPLDEASELAKRMVELEESPQSFAAPGSPYVSPRSPSVIAAAAAADASAAPTETGERESAATAEDDVEVIDEQTVHYMSAFVGEWKNVKTVNLDPYLKHMGVAWAKRKLAVAFKPAVSFSIVQGVLQSLMPSPIGERLERFPLDEEVPKPDPDGKVFLERSWWEGDTFTSCAVDPSGKKADTVTTRRVNESGNLIQRTENGGFYYERTYERRGP